MNLTRYIILDKSAKWTTIVYIILLMNWEFIYSINRLNPFLVYFILLLLVISIGLLKKDYYIRDFKIENEMLTIHAQKNFSKKKPLTFEFKLYELELKKFKSNEFLSNSYQLRVCYKVKEGLYLKKSIKTNDSDTFIRLLNIIRYKNLPSV